jgi:hypothetical protein
VNVIGIAGVQPMENYMTRARLTASVSVDSAMAIPPTLGRYGIVTGAIPARMA